jgi:hypothetical protein
MADLKMKALGLDSLFQGATLLYFIVFLVVLALVLIRAKDNKSRTGWAIAVVLGFAYAYYALFVYRTPEEKAHLEFEAKLRAELKEKYEVAKPIFDRLCAEQSQPIIKRRVEDVEGILLLRVRPSTLANFHDLRRDPMWPGAAFENERTEDSGYAEYFLLDRLWTLGEKSEAPGMRLSVGRAVTHGFRYVDILAEDGKARPRRPCISRAPCSRCALYTQPH